MRLLMMADTHVPIRARDLPALLWSAVVDADVDLDGLRLAVVHETGPATGRERRCDDRFAHRDVLVSVTRTSRGTR